MTINKKDIQSAIRRFNSGERPFKYTESRSWYVIGKNDYLYPLKYIYALATNKPPNTFNTSEPISELNKIGVDLHHQPLMKHDDFEKSIEESLKDSNSRKLRLKKASKIPKCKIVKSVVFDRNPDVVAEVLERANGYCEKCKVKAPFIRKSNRSPYLEVHHKISLADGGDDTDDNAEALCPNCHREKHFG